MVVGAAAVSSVGVCCQVIHACVNVTGCYSEPPQNSNQFYSTTFSPPDLIKESVAFRFLFCIIVCDVHPSLSSRFFI